ncbi:MAG: DUF3135 domain-containing protein [Agitococcus sp.]|nr:DUF3135 domain-containing protein [Agitococcus sp.]MDO9177015.1 DUF3135 domain-containing protein [Agitococcus sp.]
MAPFDFNAWKEMASNDPHEFERQKKKALLALVADAKPESRQALFEMIEDLCSPSEKTPLEKMVEAQNKMMESAFLLQNALRHLTSNLGFEVQQTELNPDLKFIELIVVAPATVST